MLLYRFVVCVFLVKQKSSLCESTLGEPSLRESMTLSAAAAAAAAARMQPLSASAAFLLNTGNYAQHGAPAGVPVAVAQPGSSASTHGAFSTDNTMLPVRALFRVYRVFRVFRVCTSTWHKVPVYSFSYSILILVPALFRLCIFSYKLVTKIV